MKKKTYKKCKKCKNGFIKKYRNQQFCSISCSHSYAGSMNKGKRRKYNIIKNINKNFTKIQCSNCNDIFIIDTEDLLKVIKKTWYKQNNNYIVSHDRNNGIILLHRFIMDVYNNEIIDHKNHNLLDYRKKELRICSYKDNNRNSNIPKNNTSGYKGVNKLLSGQYRAFIKVNYKQIYLGHYNNIIHAAEAYNNAAIKYFGEFAKLNEL